MDLLVIIFDRQLYSKGLQTKILLLQELTNFKNKNINNANINIIHLFKMSFSKYSRWIHCFHLS